MSKEQQIYQSSTDIRYLMRHEEEALPQRRTNKNFSGLYLITEDEMGVANILADELIYRGAFAYIIEASKYTSEEAISLEIKKARNIFGPVNGVIHLAGLKAMDFPKDIRSWKNEVQMQCKSIFHILRSTYDDFEIDQSHQFKGLITCSLLGGYYGRDLSAQAGLPISGGGQGLLKSLEYEWNSILAKTIDFDLSLPMKKMASCILDELSYGNGNTEVGYPRGNRIVFSTYRSKLNRTIKPVGLKPGKGWVVLATGGARGITSETIKLLSNENSRMILVGRSELLERGHFIKYRHLDESGLRKEFIRLAKESPDKISPSLIESKIRRTLSDREIRQNVAKLRRIGNKVDYVVCDVSDPSAFSNLINSIYEDYGKIDAVVHGAGIIQDRLLRNKDTTSLDKVFDTKVDSAFILYSTIKWDKLKAFVLFSSTAGRYGNKGQSDYAAANEVLNRLAWRMRSEHPHVVVKSLNWGPWSGVGMASSVVNDQFIERGIIPIDVQSGTGCFIGELMHGDPKEVEIVLGEGTWNPERKNELKEIFNIDLLSLNRDN